MSVKPEKTWNFWNISWFISWNISRQKNFMKFYITSHRPSVSITRPNCKARSDRGVGALSWLVANEAFSLKSASVRWAGWATVTYGRVGKLKTRVGKRTIFFSALRAEFCPPWPETLPAPLCRQSKVYNRTAAFHCKRYFSRLWAGV